MPGGLIGKEKKTTFQFTELNLVVGVGTIIDPAVCRADGLVGHIMGEVGTLPKVFQEITISYFLFRHTIDAGSNSSQKQSKVRLIHRSEILQLLIFSCFS